MGYPTRRVLGLTWVGWLNFLLLQWLGVRLCGRYEPATAAAASAAGANRSNEANIGARPLAHFARADYSAEGKVSVAFSPPSAESPSAN